MRFIGIIGMEAEKDDPEDWDYPAWLIAPFPTLPATARFDPIKTGVKLEVGKAIY